MFTVAIIGPAQLQGGGDRPAATSNHLLNKGVNMFTVAIIGPDGAGKTSICRLLEDCMPLRCKYLYMGVNPNASSHMLPTTRLIHGLKRMRRANQSDDAPSGLPQRSPSPKSVIRKVARGIKSGFSLVNRMCEEWFRQTLAWSYRQQGYVVLFDRHFYSDYFAHEADRPSNERPLSRRIHGFMLERIYPKPDLVIYLDAPAEILFARKGEGTVQSLERQRQGYLRMSGKVREFRIVNANRPQDRVLVDVAERISDFHLSRSVARRRELKGRQR